jgi:NRAMP (natural resistance-associated macrophage protein)-like metal ion transporter
MNFKKLLFKESFKKKFKRFFKILGPGVITGAADDDPSGITTYTQTGAQFGYGQLWAAVYLLPLMTAVQEACARIGAVKGKGIVAVLKEHFGKTTLYFVVILVLVANTINIGADLGAMAAAARLIIPVPFTVLIIIFTVSILILEIFTSYRVYKKILKWFALALLAYPVTLFLVRQPWLELLRSTFLPHIEFSFAFFFIITGVIGTTISPYMFFWQASEEVEEERSKHLLSKIGLPRINGKFIRNLRLDNFIGMLSSQLTAWCIIVVAATVLHAHGIANVATAADAAKALEPLVQTFPNAGLLAKMIFAFGIIGLGFLSVPVLSGSAAYALSEALNFREGLNLKLKKAHGFYGIITIATLIGLLINFIGIDPVKALIFTAVFNGVASVPLLYFIARIAGSEKIMGKYKSGKLSKILVWITFAFTAAAAAAMFITLGKL